ncbi:SDR family oxidoreductase [bacterium]|nr:SDR family oxidoreductase [bacterium]
MELGLKNKVALVAASSRGLGKAVAWALAREGTKLVICARNKKALEQTADEILMETGVTVFPLAMDLMDAERIDWLIRETMELFGKVDILVTNSGGPAPGDFEALEDQDWAKSLELTLMSAVRLIRAVIPGMKAQKWGRIINIASASVKQPIPELFLSNAIRPAVNGLTKSLSQELAPYQITVNAVCPGFFATDRVKELVRSKAKSQNKAPESVERDMIAQIPLGRMGHPDEFGELVTFLASEKANYITGTSVQIDGGFVKGLV